MQLVKIKVFILHSMKKDRAIIYYIFITRQFNLIILTPKHFNNNGFSYINVFLNGWNTFLDFNYYFNLFMIKTVFNTKIRILKF